MADGLVQSFVALPADLRLNALEQLVHVLDTTEREFVYSTISNSRNPLAILPSELNLQIFKHLPVFSTWTLQRVCRLWRKTLSSEDFLRAATTRWQTHHPSDSVGHSTADSSVEGKVRHLRAITQGLPFSKRIFDNTGTGLQGPQPKLSHRKLDFKGRRIAYISSQPGQGDAVVVRDLVSGDEKTLRGEARERILLVVLTTELVAFITFEGWLYILRLDHAASEMSRVQLPSSHVRAAGGDGYTVALAMGVSHGISGYVGSLILYDAEKQHLQEFLSEEYYWPIHQYQRPLHSCGVLVNTDQETVDIFSLTYDMHQPPRSEPHKYLQIDHLRVAFNGRWLGQNTDRVPIDFQTSVRDYQFLMAAPCPTGKKNEHRITICEVPFMGGIPFRLKYSTLFDSDSARFIRDRNHERHSLNKMNVLWKDQIHRPDFQEDWHEYVFYMNDTFLVSLEVSKLFTQHSRIRVLCFDPEVRMVGGDVVSQG